jgi:hypothetical protein
MLGVGVAVSGIVMPAAYLCSYIPCTHMDIPGCKMRVLDVEVEKLEIHLPRWAIISATAYEHAGSRCVLESGIRVTLRPAAGTRTST